MIGGDFNRIRGAHDKNNPAINDGLVDLFNNWIVDLKLREIHMGGGRDILGRASSWFLQDVSSIDSSLQVIRRCNFQRAI